MVRDIAKGPSAVLIGTSIAIPLLFVHVKMGKVAFDARREDSQRENVLFLHPPS